MRFVARVHNIHILNINLLSHRQHVTTHQHTTTGTHIQLRMKQLPSERIVPSIQPPLTPCPAPSRVFSLCHPRIQRNVINSKTTLHNPTDTQTHAHIYSNTLSVCVRVQWSAREGGCLVYCRHLCCASGRVRWIEGVCENNTHARVLFVGQSRVCGAHVSTKFVQYSACEHEAADSDDIPHAEHARMYMCLFRAES